MIILGVDPGYAITGYGVVNFEGNRFKVIDYGAIITTTEQALPERLNAIYDGLNNIINLYKPEALAIEELFFNKNIKTALTVGHGRGVAILCAQRAGLEIYEYTPLQVKQGLVGYGRAEKKQIQQMTKVILNLSEIPKPDDVADALAIAICHAHSYKMGDNRIK
jgi:crossover junction endodeoxyribonuclease RuvC